MSALENEHIYTVEDIANLPEGTRAELINGQIHLMASPTSIHQEISMELSTIIHEYIRKNKGSCRVYSAPYDVFLHKDNKTCVIPDISIICDKNKIDERGCHGAPDWIIEIVSKSTQKRDYYDKQLLYRNAGVREYWIVNPMTKSVMVYDFEHQDEHTTSYTFNTDIPVCIYPGFCINISQLLTFFE